MNKKDLEFYKKLLLEKRDEMLKERGLLKDRDMGETLHEASGENSAYSFHMADIGTDNMEREKAFFFATREDRYLYHLEQALERIEQGTYGHCHECGDEIARERLEAVPHARLCIKCKSKEEDKK